MIGEPFRSAFICGSCSLRSWRYFVAISSSLCAFASLREIFRFVVRATFHPQGRRVYPNVIPAVD
jgi:hypothetical protein